MMGIPKKVWFHYHVKQDELWDEPYFTKKAAKKELERKGGFSKKSAKQNGWIVVGPWRFER